MFQLQNKMKQLKSLFKNKTNDFRSAVLNER